MATPAQSVADRAGGNARRFHGGTRTRPSSTSPCRNRWQPLLELRQCHLGPDLLSDRQRHRVDGVRLDRQQDRAQAVLPDLRNHVHGHLAAVWLVAEPAATDRVPAAAGSIGRRPAAQSTIHHSRYLSPGTAWRGLRHDRNRHRRGADPRTHAGRRSSRTIWLALGVLPQCAGGHPGCLRDRGPGRGSPLGQGAPALGRLHRLLAHNAWGLAACKSCSIAARMPIGFLRH